MLSKTTRSYDLWHRVQNPFHALPMTNILTTGQMPDGSGFYSREMPQYVELNRGQKPGGCSGGGGGGMIAFGTDWYQEGIFLVLRNFAAFTSSVLRHFNIQCWKVFGDRCRAAAAKTILHPKNSFIHISRNRRSSLQDRGIVGSVC